MNNLSELIDDISNVLSDTANSEVIVGQPMALGSVNIVPLSRVSIGFGGGGGEGDQHFGHGHGRDAKKGKSFSGKGKGTGAGGGAKVRPVGVIIFSEAGVTVEKIPEKSGKMDKLFEKLPDFIDKLHKEKSA